VPRGQHASMPWPGRTRQVTTSPGDPQLPSISFPCLFPHLLLLPPLAICHCELLHEQRHHCASIFQSISPTEAPPTPLHPVHLPRARDRRVRAILPSPSLLLRPECRRTLGPPWPALCRAFHGPTSLVCSCLDFVEGVAAIYLDATVLARWNVPLLRPHSP
jgi:hypothetical protein